MPQNAAQCSKMPHILALESASRLLMCSKMKHRDRGLLLTTVQHSESWRPGVLAGLP
jgi:hypothetical protein